MHPTNIILNSIGNALVFSQIFTIFIAYAGRQFGGYGNLTHNVSIVTEKKKNKKEAMCFHCS